MSAARRGRVLAALALLASVAARCEDSAPPPLPTVPGATLPIAWIEVGPHRVSAEIASTERSRTRGLMFRESLPPDHGMLFVFPDEAVRYFWMRNTDIPLSIAYADTEGRIVRIADLEPRSESRVPSLHPARYALEMHQGWFHEHGVEEGDRIRSIPGRAVD